MTMNNKTAKTIWVFGDVRSRLLLELSFKVVGKAAALARSSGDKVVLFLLTPGGDVRLTQSEEDACVADGTLEEQAFAWGADEVVFIENKQFSAPTAHLFADALVPVFEGAPPRLVLFPLTDFGRDVAARCSASAGVGLIADCMELKTDGNGSIVGLCPAWGGEIMSEITFASDQVTGYVTVQPHGGTAKKGADGKGRIRRLQVTDSTEDRRIRLVSCRPVPKTGKDLEQARTVVAGGAGLGTMENFGKVRELAVAMAGQIAATRPPVLNHWIEESRLIGQTGRTVRPNLLISVGTSGAIQYTAGIIESGTIVAINRDKEAPIFKLADIGIVADAPTFLPLLISRVKQAVMRQLADEMCADLPGALPKNEFGEKIRTLRESRSWSQEQLAEETGQTPEFITDVESGKTTPPVAFLLRLSSAYGVDPGTFLRQEEKERIRDQRTQAYVNRTRNYSYQTLTSGAEQDHLRAFMVTIEPHHDHKPVAYKHEGEEFIFVMEGKLEFTLGTKVQILKRGESVHFHSNTPHKLKSLSEDVTRCLVILYTL
jgi:electron transfer flavoprotein alpha subunit/transcriptional regulator with XRE-family HTH domain